MASFGRGIYVAAFASEHECNLNKSTYLFELEYLEMHLVSS